MTPSESGKIKIVVADDHAVVRKGFIQIISNSPNFIVVDEVDNGADALKKIKEKDVDVLVMDIEMPGKNGIDIVLEAKALKPELGILILSILPEDYYALRFIKAGASGYLNKACTPDELLAAINKVARPGEKYISSSLAEKIVLDWEKDQNKASHEILTAREFQIFCKLASGLAPKKIAEELSISSATVCTHRAHILKKMDLKNNAEMTLYAQKYQLISPTI